jgi:hypothetical protein
MALDGRLVADVTMEMLVIDQKLHRDWRTETTQDPVAKLHHVLFMVIQTIGIWAIERCKLYHLRTKQLHA